MHRLTDFNPPRGTSWQNAETGLKPVLRLAALSSPPGGFWAETQKSRKTTRDEVVFMQFDHSKAQYIIHESTT